MKFSPAFSIKLSHNTYSWCLIAFALLGIGVTSVINYAVDPLQRFRLSKYYPAQFIDNQRLQVPALARSMDYNAAVIGTSTAANVFSVDANPILDLRIARLSIAGSSLREQRLLLNVVSAAGKARRILWLIDGFVLTQAPNYVREEFGPFPEYMYRNDIDGIARYLINADTLRRSLLIVSGLFHGTLQSTGDPDRLNAWIDGATFGRSKVESAYHDPVVLNAWIESFDKRMTADRVVSTATIEANITSFVRSNPNIRIDLILVPPSIAQLAFWSAHFPAYLETILAARLELARQIHGLGNAYLHDFWGDETISNDLDRYADMIHFDLRTTREIIAGVASGRYSANATSIAATEAELRSQITIFRDRNPFN